MTPRDSIRRYLQWERPRAKFVVVGDFVATGAGEEEGFWYVSLYDERIEANAVTGRSGYILIQNTYLSSFAYNLFLCWIHCARRNAPGSERRRLLAHNFKKFFAEQLLHAHGNIFSRAVFLETLLYEQADMVSVFAARDADAELDRLSRRSAELMSAAISQHELGHLMLKRHPGLWPEILQWSAGVVRPLYDEVRERWNPAYVEEFQCDVVSVVAALQSHDADADRRLALRSMVFAYAAFAVMFSLEKSAKATAADQRTMPDVVDFRSIQKISRDYVYTVGIDQDMVLRARYVIRLCEAISEHEGWDLYDTSPEFCIPATLLDDLLEHVHTVMDSTDANARSISLLVAEALHGHPAGSDFLYLRSKTFDMPPGVTL